MDNITDLRPRFESRVEIPQGPNDCWIWIGQISAVGYGQLTVRRHTILAHRWFYQLHNGPIPMGLHVLHKCDNRKCVNPDHLFLGTNADNMRDRDAKGRASHGDKHWTHQYPEKLSHGAKSPHAKLSAAQVQAIRILLEQGYTQASLGRRFGVTRTTINYIARGKTWKVP